MWFDTLLYPFKWFVAVIMVGIHKMLVMLGMNDGPGFAWVLSIIGLTMIVRTLLIPLFFRQIKAARGMQLVQPELKKLQEKYKDRKDQASKQKMSEEMMALYREHGTSPFASCMPILMQMPIFFALFRVLASTATLAEGKYPGGSIGPLNEKLAQDIEDSNLFGAFLSDTFVTASGSARVVLVVLILLMMGSQFFTMRQLTMKNMPESAKDPNNPMMRSQIIMMYLMPLMIGASGFYFQTGVLVYWFTTNMWTMGQQFWTIERMPTMGSESYTKLLNKRRNAYTEAIRPLFEEYDTAVRALGSGESQRKQELADQLLSKLKSKVSKFKVPTKFPETVPADRQIAAYRELAFSEWQVIPDEHWVKRFIPRPTSSETRVQPQRLTKAQRQANAEASENAPSKAEKLAQEVAAKSAEELEKAREARRAAKRAAKKKN
ncbi:membrane protein insertase, YidC/Oxa1 family [Gleimia coleocanis DSM 15436]|uniref:Membrane protein insertase YidC n=1 Tax=Gleimia coleocanis DSM 15436 TaxID=525245 RepID=C0VXZ9_9ACTO|nr:membrane protein insertase YidC [Gleimia coleocanis]EEH64302.1 membrane protein insertase, YidC/Oxa1 family [Gleimia coleocanis DSM 15436]